MLCWKNYKNSGFGVFWKNDPKMSKRLSQTLVQGWVKTWSMLHNIVGTKFWLQKWQYLSYFSFLRFSLHKKNIFGKWKEQIRKLGPKFDSKKGHFWTNCWLYNLYLCCRVKNWSKIWGFTSRKLVQVKVKNWSKIYFVYFCPVMKIATNAQKNRVLGLGGKKGFCENWSFEKNAKHDFCLESGKRHFVDTICFG